jgi:hypothetical protein
MLDVVKAVLLILDVALRIGDLRAGDSIGIEFPSTPYRPLSPV